MPAKSLVQQSAAAEALAVKEGKKPVKELKGSAKRMYNSMNVDQLKDFALTSRNGLPVRTKFRVLNG